MTNTQQLFTRDEKINKYVMADEKNARQYFGEKYVEGLRSTDILKDLESIEEESGLIGNQRYSRLCEEVRKRGFLTGGLINGRKGEKFTHNALDLLQTDCRVISGANLNHDGKRAEIDFVVVSKKNIYCIESKYSTTNVVIDECGLMRSNGCNHCRPYSVAEKMRSKELVLGGVLESAIGNLVKPENIRSVLVFANDGMEWEDHFGQYPICRCGNLAYTIENDKDGEIYTANQMDLIENAIRGANTEARYPLDIDLAQIDEDLAYVMDLVATRASTDSADIAEDHETMDGEGAVIAETDALNSEPWRFDWKSAAIVAPIALLLGYGISKAPNLTRKIAGFAATLA